MSNIFRSASLCFSLSWGSSSELSITRGTFFLVFEGEEGEEGDGFFNVLCFFLLGPLLGDNGDLTPAAFARIADKTLAFLFVGMVSGGVG